MSVLEKGGKGNMGKVASFTVEKPAFQTKATGAFGTIAKVGTELVDKIAENQHKVAKTAYNEAVKERDYIQETNIGIQKDRQQSMIDVQLANFKSSLDTSDYLSEGHLQSKADEYRNGLLNTISQDKILDVKRKEELKAYVTEAVGRQKADIFTKSHFARKQKYAIDLENDRADNQVAIGLAIANGDHETANKLIVADRGRRNSLMKLYPEKYSKEWSNKEGSDLTVYAGFSTINQYLNSEIEAYEQDPTEENYKKLEQNVYEKQRQFTDKNLLTQAFGSEHGLEYEEFLEKTKVLVDKTLSRARNRGSVSRGVAQKQQAVKLNDVLENTSKAYGTYNSIKGDPSSKVFGVDGDIGAFAMNEMYKEKLDSLGITLNTNNDVQEFLNSPQSKGMEFVPNLLGAENVEPIKTLVKEEKYKEANAYIEKLVGVDGTLPFIKEAINKELINKTGGQVDLNKLSYFNTTKGVEFREKEESTRDTISASNRAQRYNVNPEVVKGAMKNGELREINDNFKTFNALTKISTSNKELSLVANAAMTDISNAMLTRALDTKSPNDLEDFNKLNDRDKLKEIAKIINKNDGLSEETKKDYENIMDLHFGNNRPTTFRGKVSVIDKAITPDIISGRIESVFKDGSTLAFKDKDGEKIVTKGMAMNEASPITFKNTKDGTV
ncbi:MAG: hypothetical protein ACRC0G_04505, partial [Fusobacteriaceae bacterium]